MRHRRAFTLVELLVVIGIIALLIGILMPALNAARQASLRVACAAKLKNVVQAAQLHLNDHHGYYPLVGVMPGYAPADLGDKYALRYDYATYAQELSPTFFQCLQPITISLADEMTYHKMEGLTNDQVGAAETDSGKFIRNFLCPAQATSVSDLTQLPMLYIGTLLCYTEAESYTFNEAILGWGLTDTYNRKHGQASLVRQPALTMFAADGLMGSMTPYARARFPWQPGCSMLSLYNITLYPPITMADAFTGDGKAGDPQNFDLIRHRGKINIGFCDGHVETRYITASDLSKVFLMAP